ncbi:MAG: hypothetical protein R3A51_10625 [Nannocystaceae bacterium]|nr:HTTM domain-containing protein [Myxococcales bacterium]
MIGRVAAGLERALAAIERFYLGRVSVWRLVALRLGFGVIMTLQYLDYAADMELLFAPDGLLTHVRGASTFVAEHWQAWWIMTLVGAVAYTAGLLTRVAGLACVIGHIGFHGQGGWFTWGDGVIGHAMLLTTLVGDPGARLSIDAWLRRRLRGRAPPDEVSILPIRLIQAQIVAVYVAAGLHRIDSEGWWRGRMTFVALANDRFTRFPYLEIHRVKGLLWLGTWYTWLLELFAPIFLWIPRLGALWAVGLILMHAGLFATSTIGWWQPYMIVAISCYLPLAWVERPLAWIEARLSGRR